MPPPSWTSDRLRPEGAAGWRRSCRERGRRIPRSSDARRWRLCAARAGCARPRPGPRWLRRSALGRPRRLPWVRSMSSSRTMIVAQISRPDLLTGRAGIDQHGRHESRGAMFSSPRLRRRDLAPQSDPRFRRSSRARRPRPARRSTPRRAPCAYATGASASACCPSNRTERDGGERVVSVVERLSCWWRAASTRRLIPAACPRWRGGSALRTRGRSGGSGTARVQSARLTNVLCRLGPLPLPRPSRALRRAGVDRGLEAPIAAALDGKSHSGSSRAGSLLPRKAENRCRIRFGA